MPSALTGSFAGQKKLRQSFPSELGAFSFSTALGWMAIAWRGEKIVATRLPEHDQHALLASLRDRAREEELEWSECPPSFVKDLASLMVRHAAGERVLYNPSHLDFQSASPFFRRVYEACFAIPSGERATYGELAALAGSPLAFRAVGQAMAKNPWPLVVPCHRVLGGKDALVGFSAHGGLAAKQRLLQLEAHA